jgi:V8-like Glu-specific endopeptidase
MKFFILTSLIFSFTNAFAKNLNTLIPKVIYGQDDRMDIYESSDNLMKEISLSTAALFRDENLIEGVDGLYTAKARTLAQTGVCKTDRFSNQITAAGCSGFLVGSDRIVTAGHCVSSLAECSGQSWVFDYGNIESDQKTFTFNKDQIYRCSKIIERKKDLTTKADYAVIKLDRAVIGRAPLKIRKDGKAADDAVFTVIGHPTGLPTKITVGAEMRDNSNPIYFVTNADTFNKNSGSVVVDNRTGIVEGILVRGDTDYIETANKCRTAVYRPQDGGEGEEITRITIIKSLR